MLFVIVALLLLENFQDRLESFLFHLAPWGISLKLTNTHEVRTMRNGTVLLGDAPHRRLGANSLLSELFISFSSIFGRTETMYWL